MKSTLNVNGWPTDGARGVTSKWTTLRILLTLAGSRRRASWVGLRRMRRGVVPRRGLAAADRRPDDVVRTRPVGDARGRAARRAQAQTGRDGCRFDRRIASLVRGRSGEGDPGVRLDREVLHVVVVGGNRRGSAGVLGDERPGQLQVRAGIRQRRGIRQGVAGDCRGLVDREPETERRRHRHGADGLCQIDAGVPTATCCRGDARHGGGSGTEG